LDAKLEKMQGKYNAMRQKVGGVKHALNPANMPAIQKMNASLKHQQRKYEVKKRAVRRRLKGAVRIIIGGESESDSDDEYEEDDDDALDDDETRALKAARRIQKAKRAMDRMEDEQAQRLLDELRRRKLHQDSKTADDVEEDNWKAEATELQSRLDRFNLTKTLEELECTAWVSEFVHRGFDDVGAFANMQERELQDMFIRPKLRKRLMNRAHAYLNTIRTVHRMQESSLADRILERGTRSANVQFTFEGDHFFPTVDQAVRAWKTRPPTPPKKADKEKMVIPPDVQPRHGYDVVPVRFPFTEVPTELVGHSANIYHHAFAKLFEDEDSLGVNSGDSEDSQKRLKLLTRAVTLGDEATIVVHIEMSEEENLVKDVGIFDKVGWSLVLRRVLVKFWLWLRVRWLHTQARAHIHTLTHTRGAHTRAHTHTHTHRHIHIHTHTHTYIYTRTHTR
jgi:hypothetical protein